MTVVVTVIVPLLVSLGETVLVVVSIAVLLVNTVVVLGAIVPISVLLGATVLVVSCIAVLLGAIVVVLGVILVLLVIVLVESAVPWTVMMVVWG